MENNLLLTLPADPHKRAAEVVAFINGHDTAKRAIALESQAENLRQLADPASRESMQALAAHLPVLEALFHRLSVEAISCRHALLKVALMRAALQAQTAYARTVALLSGLHLQNKGSGCVALEADTWE